METFNFVGLPLEVAQCITTLLETDDRSALARVCRATAANIVYNPPNTGTLSLPPTDQVRAHCFLQCCDPTRCVRYLWIEIAHAWQVDLLAESKVADAVIKLRVRPDTVRSIAAVEAICAKFGMRSNLTALDLSRTPIADISGLRTLTQLRMLDLSYTQVTDTWPLMTLIHVEELVCLEVSASNMDCIEHMTELHRLEVTHIDGQRIAFPSISALTKLESLAVGVISVPSVADFVSACLRLRRLTISALYARTLPEGTESNHHSGFVPLSSFVCTLQHLEFIDDWSGTATPRTLSTIPTLRIIKHKLLSEFESLVKLQHIEELCLTVGETPSSMNYRFLLRLPYLKTLLIDQDVAYRDDEFAMSELQSCLDIVVVIPLLETLKFECVLQWDRLDWYFQRFGHLKTLTLPKHESVSSFAILSSCRLLRSLTIQVYCDMTDLSAIGTLPQLEELHLSMSVYGVYHDPPDDQQLPFLAQLVHLTSLYLQGPFCDLMPLQNLVKLRQLALIHTSFRSIQSPHVLGRLQRLRELDIRETTILNLAPLVHLHNLRTVILPPYANCRVLTECDHPSLLRVLHPTRNCLCKSPTDVCE